MTLDVTIVTAENAMRQAVMTADEYLCGAIERIDTRLGKGYAAQHPDLVAAFMRTAAQDFHTTLTKTAAQDFRDELGDTMERVAEAVEKASEAAWGDMRDWSRTIAGAIESVATAIDGLAGKTFNIAEMLDLHFCGRPIAPVTE